MSLIVEQRLKALALVMLAVLLASMQDAIVKSMAGTYPAYETVIIRCCTSLPLLAFWLLLTTGIKSLSTPLLPRLLLRGLVMCSAYFAFILSIAIMPIANAIAIYFVMPFFVAVLAGPFLGEHVPVYRWLAMTAGFLGVLVMVRPGTSSFEPASFLALYSAFGYAVGAIMVRPLAQHVQPVVIGNIQNVIYLVVALIMFIIFHVLGIALPQHKSLTFLSRPLVMPDVNDFMLMALMGVLAAGAIVCFISAYKHAQSSFVAPFEYTGMVWAVLFGLLFFGDFPDAWTWVGMAIVVAAGLLMMWRDTQIHRTG